MSKHIKTFVFSAILSLICGALLTLASTGLKPYQLKNVALDKQKNILKSVGLVDEQNPPTSETIERLFSENIRSMKINSKGNIVSDTKQENEILPIFFYVKQDRIEAYSIPFDCRGLWGGIHGYVAMKNDGKTVLGFTVYEHSETPGLGGEISKNWFQKNFEGKRILNEKNEFVSVSIVKGRVADKIEADRRQNFVDGISGASMTGKFLTQGLKETLGSYEAVSKRFRTNEIKRIDDL